MQRFRQLGAMLLLALGLVAGPAAVAPAAAHGGPLDIELGTDGAGGVSAMVTWQRDGHPVEESAVIVVRAVSDTGEEAGPVTLASAPEGVGWYRSEPGLLGEGHWTVTARAKEPGKAKVEVELDVVAPPSAPPSEPAPSDPSEPADVGADVGADGAGAAAAGDGSPSRAGLPAWAGWGLGALVAAGAATAAVVLRRRTT